MLLHTKLINTFYNKQKNVCIICKEVDCRFPPLKKPNDILLYNGIVDVNQCVMATENKFEELEQAGYEPTIEIVSEGPERIIHEPTEKVMKTKKCFILIEFY